MAFTTLSTIAVGDPVTAALLDQLITNNNLFVDEVLFTGAQSATQSLTSAIAAALTLDTESKDTYGGHSTSVNTSRYTIPAALNATRLQFNGIAAFAANATGGRAVEIRKNGTAIANGRVAVGPPAATNGAFLQVVCTGTVVTGDFIEVWATQASGGALSTVAGSSLEISFAGIT